MQRNPFYHCHCPRPSSNLPYCSKSNFLWNRWAKWIGISEFNRWILHLIRTGRNRIMLITKGRFLALISVTAGLGPRSNDVYWEDAVPVATYHTLENAYLFWNAWIYSLPIYWGNNRSSSDHINVTLKKIENGSVFVNLWQGRSSGFSGLFPIHTVSCKLTESVWSWGTPGNLIYPLLSK